MCYCLFALQHQCNYLSISIFHNDEWWVRLTDILRGAILQKICWKKRKKSARIALRAKNAPALRQMPKNAAHAEKPKKYGIFMRRTIAFFPRVYQKSCITLHILATVIISFTCIVIYAHICVHSHKPTYIHISSHTHTPTYTHTHTRTRAYTHK